MDPVERLLHRSRQQTAELLSCTLGLALLCATAGCDRVRQIHAASTPVGTSVSASRAISAEAFSSDELLIRQTFDEYIGHLIKNGRRHPSSPTANNLLRSLYGRPYLDCNEQSDGLLKQLHHLSTRAVWTFNIVGYNGPHFEAQAAIRFAVFPHHWIQGTARGAENTQFIIDPFLNMLLVVEKRDPT